MDNKIRITIDGKQITIRFNPERMKFEYNYGYKDNLGKRQSRLIRGNSVEELKQAIIDFKNSISSTDITTSNITFENYIKYYLHNISRIKNKPTTTDKLRYSLNCIPESIRAMPLAKLTTQQLQLVYTDLYSKYAQNTVKGIHMAVDIVLNNAVKSHIIEENPNKNCEVLGFTNGEKQYISPSQAKNFLQFLKDSNEFSCLYKLVLFYITTGVRRGEGLGLKKDCVDFTNHTVSIKGQIIYINHKSQYVDYLKTKSSERTIQLSKDVFNIITDYTNNNTEFVFVNSQGKEWSHGYFGAVLKKAFKEFGLPNMSIKQLRNSFVKTAILNNIPLKIVQQVLGHAKQSTTADIYGELLDSDAYMISDVMQQIYSIT